VYITFLNPNVFDLDLPEDGQSKNNLSHHMGAVANRPDGLIHYDKLKKWVYIELTSLKEEKIDKFHFCKFDKI